MVYHTGDNNFGTAKWIVDATGGQGTHTTIATALTSSASGDTIFIRPGTYTENLSLKAGVNLTAFSGDGDTPNVTIIGKATFLSAGTCTISNIRLQTNSDFFLVNSGTAASIVNLEYCYLNCSNNTGISHTSNQTTSKINIFHCQGNIGTTGITLCVSSSAGPLNISYSYITNTGASVTATSSSAAAINLFSTYLFFPITITSTGAFGITSSVIDSSATNTTAITCTGSGNGTITSSTIASGTASAITCSQTLTLNLVTIYSSNTNALTGAGTINSYAVNYASTSHKSNVTTQTGGAAWGLTQGTAPTAGCIGEQIRSAIGTASGVALTTNTTTNITSISLTAGIWDVSCVCTFTGSTTGTAIRCSIVTTSATDGTSGDNSVNLPFGGATTNDFSLTIPSYRITLSSTTTVYMTALIVYTVGSAKGFGRISGTRVG